MSDGSGIADTPLVIDETGLLGRIFAHPRAILFAGVGLLVLSGWLYLGAMVAQLLPVLDMSDAGPGMGVFNLVAEHFEFSPLARDLLRSLCGPLFALGEGAAWSAYDIAAVFAMWVAMTLAMMVPTAAPMIWTYSDIAIAARHKDMDIVPTGVLLAGYLSVWLVFCIVATLGQWLMASAALLSPGLMLASVPAAAAVMIIAGIYQFLPMKHACLVKCRTSLPFFMANWSDKVAGVYKMGARQGLICVMCCWALMSVMFAVGLMNIIWMAALAAVMALEKVVARPRWVTRGTGGVLIAYGIVLIVGMSIQ